MVTEVAGSGSYKMCIERAGKPLIVLSKGMMCGTLK